MYEDYIYLLYYSTETIPDINNGKHKYSNSLLDDYDVDTDITEYIKNLNDLSDYQTEIVFLISRVVSLDMSIPFAC